MIAPATASASLEMAAAQCLARATFSMRTRTQNGARIPSAMRRDCATSTGRPAETAPRRF
eukprot:5777292-Pleurochrysis_carterae.AAC.2